MNPFDSTTLPPSVPSQAADSTRDADECYLVVLWSRDEPGRAGEVLRIPREFGPWIFGRGAAGASEQRAALVRRRADRCEPTPPLSCVRISRSQLSLSQAPGGRLALENIGACACLHNGHEIKQASLAAGDTLLLKNELLFLCVVGRVLLEQRSDHPQLSAHPFGEADAFGLVGESQVVWELRRTVVALARQPFHLLVLGESGSGKELVAQALHSSSERAKKALVSRNAATIPDGLFDAELFGNIKNYPNPGMVERPGLIGQAHGSSLFLDEFADLPRALQPHLLRVLDEGEYQRLGEATTRRSDLRLIAATNRPESDIKPDLLARLKARIDVPGLNARREDIPLLIVHLLRRYARAGASFAVRFFPEENLALAPLLSPTLVEALVTHEYTTHVRELEALLLHCALASHGRYLELARDLRPSQGALPLKPPPDPNLVALSPEDQTRLLLLRQHRFSATACGRDPAYPGNRQTADLHFRYLMSKVLQLAGWKPALAARWLAGGPDPELNARAAARLHTFLGNLRERLAAEPTAELRGALLSDWKGNADTVLALLDALLAGEVSAQ